MTREEAHRILSNGLVNAPSEHEWCMAFEMAIQALSQELCDDAISRQYLIDIATKDGAYDYVSAQEIANAPTVTLKPIECDAVSREAVLEAVSEGCQEWRGIYGRCEELINALPPVNQWIPVSERLPEEREWYLAVFKEKDTAYQLIPRVADYIGKGENKWRIIDEEGLCQEYRDILECIAWMPLPKPYEPQERSKE